jgi:hypothetical protein
MKLIAIDPGDTESAYVFFDNEDAAPIGGFAKMENHKLLKEMPAMRGFADELAIEMVACYGMPVGASVFNTCVWVGRFIQALGGKYAD